MKIGYFSTHFPYSASPEAGIFPVNCGGGENVAYNLAIQMARRGHDVSVLTSSWSEQDVAEKDGTLHIYRYGTWFRIGNGFFSPNLIIKPIHHEFDIVHLHMTVPVADFASMVYAKFKRVPLIITYHGDNGPAYGGLIRRGAILLTNLLLHDQTLASAKVIVSPSAVFINESRSLPKYRNIVVAIPNGISVDQCSFSKTKQECRKTLGISSNAKVILFVGALKKYKAPDVLIRAMEKVAKQSENVELIVVGDGEMKAELHYLSEKLGIKNLVRFTGFIQDVAEKSQYYKAADVFVLPSVMGPELFPIVLLEASVMELPLLVSDLPQLAEFVEHGVNGLVTKKGDDADLAAAIMQLIVNEELMGRLGKKAREKVKQFSWESIAQQYEKVYEEMLR